jgi:hypothetical protein
VSLTVGADVRALHEAHVSAVEAQAGGRPGARVGAGAHPAEDRDAKHPVEVGDGRILGRLPLARVEELRPRTEDTPPARDRARCRARGPGPVREGWDPEARAQGETGASRRPVDKLTATRPGMPPMRMAEMMMSRCQVSREWSYSHDVLPSSLSGG